MGDRPSSRDIERSQPGGVSRPDPGGGLRAHVTEHRIEPGPAVGRCIWHVYNPVGGLVGTHVPDERPRAEKRARDIGGYLGAVEIVGDYTQENSDG